MSRSHKLPPPSMAPFSPVHQPDEGYSEDPLNPTGLSDRLSILKSPTELPQWLAANASLLPVSVKAKLAMTILDQLPTSAVAEIVQRLNPRLYIDFIQHLPAEICLKILGYLDFSSIVGVLQTCRAWYDLAVDRNIWKNLYYLEGWKVVQSEIISWEKLINTGLSNSIDQLHQLQSLDSHPKKMRAILNKIDEDLEMHDQDRLPVNNENDIPEASYLSALGSPSMQPSSLLGEVDLDAFLNSRKRVDPTIAPLEGRAKRKQPGGIPEASLTSFLTNDAASITKSTLWSWDVSVSQYRINWKYLYNMRRRLESNWELGKFTTFVLPHPNHPEEGHQECIYTLQFDANYLVSGSRDRTLRVWNMHTRRLARPPLTGHTGSVLCLQFDADPSEDILVSGSSDSNVFVWRFSTGQIIQKLTNAHSESVLNVRFDKRVLVTSSKDKTIKIFNRRPLRYGDVGYGTPDELINPVGTRVKPYGYQPDLSQELPVRPPFTLIARLDGHCAAVNAIQVRGSTIVSVSGDRHIKMWNWPEQVCTRTIPAHDKGIACVEFDGRRIVSGSSDYEVCIFDAPTGLKVASLRGHAHLVRTVQAGFSDLPYSIGEDEAEARRVDNEYFNAVEAGEITHEAHQRPRRGRRANPGSARPTDVQATGAKIPPGGGGSRKFGRIVSGSYDQSIIIWRRDKEGVWKPAHHLRQEAAADAANREAAVTNVQRNNTQLASAAVAAAVPTADSEPQQGMGSSSVRDPASSSSLSADLYMAMIDQVVPLGVASLRQALADHPSMLIHHSYLQAAVEREPSPFVRPLLRQAISDSLLTVQVQFARHRLSTGASSRIQDAILQSSDVGIGASGASTSAHVPPVSSSASAAHSLQVAAAAAAGAGASVAQAPIPLTPAPQQAQPSLPPTQTHPPQVPASGPQSGPQASQTHSQQHPRIAQAENGPARVFKLQFDARKIVCCTQTPLIVGWDFCNGDRELEEASRLFATVD